MNPDRRALPAASIAFALLALLATARPAAATTYTWVGGGDDSWTTATHWNPARTTPQTSDVLVFDRGDSIPVNGVSSETIAGLWITAGSTVRFQSSVGTMLSFAGTTAPELQIDAACKLYLSGPNGITLNLPLGRSGSVAGDVILRDGPHRLIAGDVDGLGFLGGSSAQTTGAFSGNPFGTSNLNAVRFYAGSLYVSGAGSNPFGAPQPNSVVRFDPGSRFRLDAGTPASSGRTYADFELNIAGSTTMTGSSAVTMDSLIVTRGTLSVQNSSARFNGAIRVPTGSFLQFNPASAAVYTLGGTSPQWIRTLGSNFTAASTVTLAIDDPAGVDVDSTAFRTQASLSFLHGNLVLPSPGPDSVGPALIDPPGTIAGADTSTGWIVGGVRTLAQAGPSTTVLPIGDADRYLPIVVMLFDGAAEVLTGTVLGRDDPTVGSAQLRRDRLVHRRWSLGYPPESYSKVWVQMDYRLSDLDPGTSPDSLVIRNRSNTHGWQRTTRVLGNTGRIVAEILPTFSQNSFRFALGESAQVYADAGRVAQPEAAGPLGLPVTLSQPSIDTVRVAYATVDSTALVADGDYVAAAGTLVFAPGDTARTVDVTVNDDTKPEPDESFLLALGPVENAVARYRGEGVILNDDASLPPTVQVLSPNGGEHAVVGTVLTVTWQATDDVGVTGVDLLLSRDGGATNEILAQGLPNTGSHDWTVTGPVTNTASIEAIAHDADGHQTGDLSDAPFFIDDVAGAPTLPRPTAFALAPVSPNPARGEARFTVALPRRAAVRLTVLDARGRAVATPLAGELDAGVHPVVWDGRVEGRRAAAGVYFVRCEAGDWSARARFVLLR